MSSLLLFHQRSDRFPEALPVDDDVYRLRVMGTLPEVLEPWSRQPSFGMRRNGAASRGCLAVVRRPRSGLPRAQGSNLRRLSRSGDRTPPDDGAALTRLPTFYPCRTFLPRARPCPQPDSQACPLRKYRQRTRHARHSFEHRPTGHRDARGGDGCGAQRGPYRMEYSPSRVLPAPRTAARYYNGVGVDVTADEVLVTTGGSEALVFAFMSC